MNSRKLLALIFGIALYSTTSFATTYYCGTQIIKIVNSFVSSTDPVRSESESAHAFDLKQKVLREIENQPIEIHQNGHLRINIQIEGQRFDLHIHMKDPIVPVAREFRMHDHVFDLHSYILRGELEDIDFSLTENPEGTFFIVRTESRDGRVDPQNNLSVYQRDDRRFKITEINRTLLSAGQAYWLSRGIVHESNPLTPETITVTQRIFPEVRQLPVVLAPIDAGAALEKRIKFDRQAFDHERARQIARELIEGVNSPELWAGLSQWILARVLIKK